MSYDEYDAWIDEKHRTTFDFELLSLGDISPPVGARYLATPKVNSPACLEAIHSRLCFAFGSTGDEARLSDALRAVAEVVEIAISNNEEEARQAFLYGENLSCLCRGEGPYGLEEPARAFLESLEAVGPADGFSEQELCAALGLRLIGNLSYIDEAPVPDLHALEAWTLGETSLLLAEAYLYLGRANATREVKSELSRRNKRAAVMRHKTTNTRKDEARRWYLAEGNKLTTKAEAARVVEELHCIAYEVAKRWIADFDRGTERPRPRSYGDSASQRRDGASHKD